MADPFLESFLNPMSQFGLGAMPPVAEPPVKKRKPGDPYWDDPAARANPFPGLTSALSGIGATINTAASSEMANAMDARVNPAAHSVTERFAGWPEAIKSGLRYGATPQEQAKFAAVDAVPPTGAGAAASPSLMDSIINWFRGGATPQPATVAAPAPIVAPAPQGLTVADIEGRGVPAPGTGAFINNTTGKVTNLNTGRPSYGAGGGRTVIVSAPQEDSYTNTAAPGTMASAVGAILNMKQRSADAEARAAARGAQVKAMGTPKDRAEAAEIQARLALAGAAPNLTAAGAILNKHNPPEPKLQAPPGMQPMPGDKDQTGVVFDSTSGVFRKVPIQPPPITQGNIDAALAGSMKGKTRAQVIQAYRDKGYDVSGVN